MEFETRFFVRTFRHGADQVLETAEILELPSQADAMGAVQFPVDLAAGAVALAMRMSDDVEITLLNRRGEIPDGIARLYGA